MIKEVLRRAVHWIFKGVPVNNIKAVIVHSDGTKRLVGKKILITGGAQGLGYAFAKMFIAEGAHVVITGRNETKLKEASNSLGCKYLVFDVCHTESIEDIINQASDILGGLDCLVNNAGISLHEGSILNVSEDQFNKQIETNLKGSYFISRHFIKYLIENKSGGNILFVSSERGQTVETLPYGLTKAAINSLTQGLAYDLIPMGIRVNAIAPGVTATEMTGFAADGNLACNWMPNGRVYLPEEVAEVATWLLSDLSACVSGQIIYCNNAKTVNHSKK